MTYQHHGRKARVPYKVTVSLFPHEWDELAMEAKARNISGGELIAGLLSQYVAGHSDQAESYVPPSDPQDA